MSTTTAPAVEKISTTPAARTPSARWVLLSLSITVMLSSLNTSIANVALPTLAHAFDASFQAAQWIVLSYLLAITTLIVSAGRLGDTLGRRRLLVGGIALFTVASALCGGAPTLWILLIGRTLQGLGAAIMMALTLAFVSQTVSTGTTGRAMGLLGTMSAVGTALGPSLGGLLISAFGWRAVFLVNVPLGLGALLLAQRHLPDDRAERNRRSAAFDGIGTLLLVLTLAAYALAMTIGRGRFGLTNGMLMTAAVVGVGLFVRAEAQVSSPLIRLSLFRDRTRRTGLLTSALVSAVMMTTLIVGPFYLSQALGLDAARVGLVLSVGPLVAAVCGVPAGRIVDRLGASRVTIAGLVGMVIGLVMLCMIPTTLGVSGYLLPMIVVTAGYAFFQTANNTAVMSGVGANERGVISGLLNLSRNLGLITGASVMAAIFAFAASRSDAVASGPEAIATGMRATFALAAVLIVTALFISAVHGRSVRSTRSR